MPNSTINSFNPMWDLKFSKYTPSSPKVFWVYLFTSNTFLDLVHVYKRLAVHGLIDREALKPIDRTK